MQPITIFIMCYTATLPSVIKSDSFDSELFNLTRIFNRWMKMLTSYGKLDKTCLNSDFTAMAKVIKSNVIKKDVREAIQSCRDLALGITLNIEALTRSLSGALKLMCMAQEDLETRIIKQRRVDQGMSERYRPLTKRLQRERIKKINRDLIYTNFRTENPETNRLVRRIVEKRAAQTVHRTSKGRDRETNQFRQKVRRATSFSLYTSNFIDYDAQKRAPGTHWKVVYCSRKGKRMLKAKFSYNSYEEAVEACNEYTINHPEDLNPMTAYKCDYCGKWHIGHER